MKMMDKLSDQKLIFFYSFIGYLITAILISFLTSFFVGIGGAIDQATHFPNANDPSTILAAGAMYVAGGLTIT